MYEGTPNQFIVPLHYNRDALYVDYRPLAANEQVAFVKANPLRTDQWLLDSPTMARDSIEVMDVSNEFDDSDCEDFITHAHKPCDHMVLQRSAEQKMQGGSGTALRNTQIDETTSDQMVFEKTQDNTGGSSGTTSNRRSQKKRDRYAAIDQRLRDISHDAMSHCGEKTLDETITREVMNGCEKLPTSERLERALGLLRKLCSHCETGKAQKQST
jgi:hypothetical protein